MVSSHLVHADVGTQLSREEYVSDDAHTITNGQIGDMIYYDGDCLTRLPIDTDGKILGIVAGRPQWIDAIAGGGVVTNIEAQSPTAFTVARDNPNYALQIDTSNPLGVTGVKITADESSAIITAIGPDGTSLSLNSHVIISGGLELPDGGAGGLYVGTNNGIDMYDAHFNTTGVQGIRIKRDDSVLSDHQFMGGVFGVSDQFAFYDVRTLRYPWWSDANDVVILPQGFLSQAASNITGNLVVDGTINATGGYIGIVAPGASDIDMQSHIIQNIGNPGTDFTGGGGLNLAGDLNAAANVNITGVLAASNFNLNGLPDVTITSVTDNQILAWNAASSQWINKTPVDMVGASYIGDLLDVTITSVADRHILTWDSGTSQWINIPQQSQMYSYKYFYQASTTMADPGSGNFRTNQTSPTPPTQMAIDIRDGDNVDIAALLAALRSGDTIRAQLQTDSTIWRRVRLTADPTDMTSWFLLDVVEVGGSGTVPASGSCLLTFFLSGGGTAGMSNPMTTQGDIIIGGAGGTPTRLGAGTDLQVLKLSSGSPVWMADIGFNNPMTAQYDLILGGSGGSATRLAIGSHQQVLMVTGSSVSWQDQLVKSVNGQGGNVNLDSYYVNITGDTMTGPLVITSATSTPNVFGLTVTDPGNTGVWAVSYHNSPTPANADTIFKLDIAGNNQGLALVNYAQITAGISDVTTGSVDGNLMFNVAINDVLTNALYIYQTDVTVKRHLAFFNPPNISWAANWSVIDWNREKVAIGSSASADNLYLMVNTYYDGTNWKNTSNASVSSFVLGTVGNFTWYSDSSPGAADTTYTRTTRMSLGSTGILTINGSLTVNDANASPVGIQINSTSTGSLGALLDAYHSTSSPADGDIPFLLRVNGRTSTNALTEWGQLYTTATTVLDSNKNSTWTFKNFVNNGYIVSFVITGGANGNPNSIAAGGLSITGNVTIAGTLAASNFPGNLDSLTDVIITAPSNTQVLTYNGTNWVNSAATGGATNLDALTDVIISSPSNAQILQYNGTNWVNATAGAGAWVGTATSNLNMSNFLIQNIGAAGTDFTSGGGLTLAGDLLPAVTGTLNLGSLSFTWAKLWSNQISVSGPVATYRTLEFQTAGSVRWSLVCDNTAESGANAGSNFVFNAFTDAGAYLSTPFTITRSNGTLNANNGLNVSGTFTANNAGNIYGAFTVAAAIAAGSYNQTIQNTTATGFTGISIVDSAGTQRAEFISYNASYVGNNDFGVAAASTVALSTTWPLYIGTTGANSLILATNSLPRWYLDSAGRIGIGASPKAWATTWTVIEHQSGKAGFAADASGALYFTQNSYYDGTNWRSISTAAATMYNQPTTAYFAWFTAPSVTAGAVQTYTERMRLDVNGRFGLGSNLSTAWTTTFPIFEISSGRGAIHVDTGFNVGLEANLYYDGTNWRNVANAGIAQTVWLANGSIQFFAAASPGAAGTVATLTARMTIDPTTTTVANSFRHTGSQLGFFNATVVSKSTVTGAKGSNAALGNLLIALNALGLITDSTTT